jgi:predicted transcriptional regulator
MPRPPVNDRELTQAELDSIEQFNTLFNRVEGYLRTVLHEPDETGFGRLLALYLQGGPACPDMRGKLQRAQKLRNVLVHQRGRRYQYVAIPTKETIRQVRDCYLSLIGDTRARDKFASPVVEVTSSDTLADVLAKISENDFSQFPVYDGNDFRGLLTENGIVRWIAHHILQGRDTVDFGTVSVERVLVERVFVRELLEEEEERAENVRFEEDTATVDDVRRLFAENNLLEAVLITENGRPDEKLLAIATRSDVAGM